MIEALKLYAQLLKEHAPIHPRIGFLLNGDRPRDANWVFIGTSNFVHSREMGLIIDAWLLCHGLDILWVATPNILYVEYGPNRSIFCYVPRLSQEK